MLRCDDCGWIGEPEDLKRVQESRGEFWGMPAYETMYYCPCCGGDYLEDYIEEEEADDFDIDLAREVAFSEVYN